MVVERARRRKEEGRTRKKARGFVMRFITYRSGDVCFRKGSFELDGIIEEKRKLRDCKGRAEIFFGIQVFRDLDFLVTHSEIDVT